MNKKNLEIAVYVSAIMVAVGVFLPLASLPVVGDISYNRVADIESYIVIAFALSAPVLVFLAKHKLAICSAVGVWLTLLFPALKNLGQSEEKSSAFGNMMKKAASPVQDFAADLFMNITDFSWGGFVFLIGLLVLTVVSAMLALGKSN